MDRANNIYIINLKKHTDRWEKIVDECKKYPMSYQRFEGIYGKDLSLEQIEAISTPLARNLLINHGTIGCFLSHVNLWSKLVQDEENDFYLILEDDFTISDFSKLSYLYDLFNSGMMDKKVQYLSLFTNAWNLSLKDEFKYDDITISKKIFPNTTLGYFITKEGAKKFLKKINGKVKYHIDLYLTFLSKVCQDVDVYNTKENILTRNDLGLETSSINNSQKKTLLYFLIPYRSYFELQYPLLVIKLKKVLSVEFILSLILGILLVHFGWKWKNVLFVTIGIFFLINAVLAYF